MCGGVFFWCVFFFLFNTCLLKEKRGKDLISFQALVISYCLGLFCGSNADNVAFLRVDGNRLFSVSWMIRTVLSLLYKGIEMVCSAY